MLSNTKIDTSEQRLSNKSFMCHIPPNRQENTIVLLNLPFQALKIKYYKLMIELGQHKKDYLNICKNYQALFNTPKVQEDETRWREVCYYVYNCVLCCL